MSVMETVERADPASANAIGLPAGRHCIDCGAPVTKKAVRCLKCSYLPRSRPMPDDFAAMAAKMSSQELTRHYRAGAAKVLEWLEALTGKRATVVTRVHRRALPEGFAILASSLSTAELCDRFDAGKETVRRWRREAGVRAPQRRNLVVRGPGTSIHAPSRDLSIEGRAVEYLRRYGPVYRCDASGIANAKGNHWCRGGYVLTGEEILSRATRLGFDPDAWRRVA